MAEPYKNYSFFAAELYLLITKRMRCSPTHTRENKVEKIKELPFSLHPNIWSKNETQIEKDWEEYRCYSI